MRVYRVYHVCDYLQPYPEGLPNPVENIHP
jgi:hypothetical protein